MAQLFANNAATTLASGVAAGDTSLTVTDGSKFPAPTGNDYFLLTLTQPTEVSWEIVKVTARSGNVLTVVRGQEGTFAAAWAADDKAELRLTAATVSGKQDTLVSGTNIKTINGTSVLGSGNLEISGGGGASGFEQTFLLMGA